MIPHDPKFIGFDALTACNRWTKWQSKLNGGAHEKHRPASVVTGPEAGSQRYKITVYTASQQQMLFRSNQRLVAKGPYSQ